VTSSCGHRVSTSCALDMPVEYCSRWSIVVSRSSTDDERPMTNDQ
jgi:hypothetical protein